MIQPWWCTLCHMLFHSSRIWSEPNDRRKSVKHSVHLIGAHGIWTSLYCIDQVERKWLERVKVEKKCSLPLTIFSPLPRIPNENVVESEFKEEERESERDATFVCADCWFLVHILNINRECNFISFSFFVMSGYDTSMGTGYDICISKTSPQWL